MGKNKSPGNPLPTMPAFSAAGCDINSPEVTGHHVLATPSVGGFGFSLRDVKGIEGWAGAYFWMLTAWAKGARH